MGRFNKSSLKYPNMSPWTPGVHGRGVNIFKSNSLVENIQSCEKYWIRMIPGYIIRIPSTKRWKIHIDFCNTKRITPVAGKWQLLIHILRSVSSESMSILWYAARIFVVYWAPCNASRRDHSIGQIWRKVTCTCQLKTLHWGRPKHIVLDIYTLSIARRTHCCYGHVCRPTPYVCVCVGVYTMCICFYCGSESCLGIV